MPKRTRAQKMARRLQTATGKPYTACLNMAKALIAKEEQACSASTAPPTSSTAAG